MPVHKGWNLLSRGIVAALKSLSRFRSASLAYPRSATFRT